MSLASTSRTSRLRTLSGQVTCWGHRPAGTAATFWRHRENWTVWPIWCTLAGARWSWIFDLDAWAHVVARLLKPGGIAHIFDDHPVIWLFDETAETFVPSG
jgi:hypothetical protein